MKSQFRRIQRIERSLMGAFVVVMASLVNQGCGAEEDVGPGVTKDGIRRIRIGMSERDVVGLIGNPLEVELERGSPEKRTLKYSRPVSGAMTYPMIWVGLEDDKVRLVYVKRYFMWESDDDAVYLLNDRYVNGWESSRFKSVVKR
jgi:hypothetical protein